MTALNKQAYRADGGDIGIGRLKEIADNAYSDEEKRWLAQRVLSLLDENLQLQRDKDSLEAVAIAMRDDMRDAREKLEAAEKRIAELQVARDKCFLSGLKTGWEYGIADDTECYNREIADAQTVIDRAAGIGVKGSEMADKSPLERLQSANKENQRMVMVSVGTLKAARSEIMAHVSVNGKGVMTDIVLNQINAVIGKD